LETRFPGYEEETHINSELENKSSEEVFYYLEENIGRKEVLDLIREDIISVEDSFGQTVLHWAAVKGNKKVVEYLLKRDEDMVHKITVHDEYTPLHLAILSGKHDIAELLIEEHPFLANIPDKHGRTPLYLYVEKGGPNDMIQKLYYTSNNDTVLLQTKDEKFTALHLAIRKEDQETAKVLCSNCFRISTSTDKYGQTPLHWAAWKGYYDVCKSLCKIMRKYEINTKSNKDRSALDFAIQSGHNNIRDLLIKYGAT